MTQLLETLLSVPTVSGGEKALTDKIDRYIKKYTDHTHTDSLGNLTATQHAVVKGGKKPLKIVFFCAVDAPGRIVTYLEENGRIRTAPIGKTSPERMVYTEVVKAGDSKYTGILVPENGQSGQPASEPLYADFSFENAEQAAKHLAPGDLLCLAAPPVRLNQTTVFAPALGNKLCAAALSLLAKETEGGASYEISYVFGAQSVLGARGAAPAAFALKPDIAVCLEAYEGNELGLRLADRFSVSDDNLVQQFKNAAAQTGTTLVPLISSEESVSDASRINGAGIGAPCVTLLYPVNAHGMPRERADTSFCEPLKRLLLQFLNNLSGRMRT